MLHYPRLLTSSGTLIFQVNSADLKLDADDQCNEEGLSLFIASWLSLLSDSPITSSHKPKRLYTRFYNELCENLKGVVIRFADLAHQFVSQHTLMGPSTSIGEWLDGFEDTPVFFEYIRYTRTGDPALLKYLYTFLNFGKKLEYVDEDFNETAFRGWLENEKAVSDLTFTDDDYIVLSLRKIISEVLPYTPSDFWPRHGPGAVSERIRKGKNPKHSAMCYDSILDRFFFHGHIGMYGLGEEYGLSPNKVIPNNVRWKPKEDRPRIPAKLRFVPKNLKVSRSICMEPVTLMFFQQAVARRMCEAIENGPLREAIRLKDQSYNRNLALIGSYTGEIDTLDLSSASDRISFDLVKKIFPSSWLIQMIATRSSRVDLPNGDEHALRKFAPMGSALCFPTQCVIFASVCILAGILYGIHSSPDELRVVLGLEDFGGYSNLFQRWNGFDPQTLERICSQRVSKSDTPRQRNLPILRPLGVYGDDICCDTHITGYVKSILCHLGFLVNEEKSFVGGQSFRESCGGFYLDGIDVDPVFYRIKDVRRKLTPSQIYSQVHLINEARARGYKCLYSFLLYSLREWYSRYGKFSIPFVPAGSTEFGIVASSQENKHLTTRENVDYQRTEYRVWSITNDQLEQDTWYSERYDHMRWWASACDESRYDSMSYSHRSAVGYRVKWRWTPLY